jgi:hypothetical protein
MQNPVVGTKAESKDSSAQSTSPTQKLLLKDATFVKLKLKRGVYSQYAKIGDEVDYLVDEEVAVNGKIIVPEGAIVKGKVVSAEHKRTMGEERSIYQRIRSNSSTAKAFPCAPCSTRAEAGKDWI